MSKKITTEDFIRRAKIKHGDEYDYSSVHYIKSKLSVQIICKKHGKFLQQPNNHLNGKGCFKCYGTPKPTTEEFIIKAKSIHGDRYDYSKTVYGESNSTKLIIICSKHGEFRQRPNQHLQGSGCGKCAGKKYTTEDFISEAITLHGDKYDYSKVIYDKCNSVVDIICPIHGTFPQTPTNHLQGAGCGDCGGSKKLTTEKFIQRANTIYGNRYNYTNVVYKNNNTKIDIICQKHGSFPVTPAHHLNGSGCPKCAGRNITKEDFITEATRKHHNKYTYDDIQYVNVTTKVYITCPTHGKFLKSPTQHLKGSGCKKCKGLNIPTTSEFISKSKMIHGDIYDYSLVNYINAKSTIQIICKVHGVFPQTPNNHLNGQGCQICNVGYNITYRLHLLDALQNTDLLSMDPVELITIIGQGNLPIDFRIFADTEAYSDERRLEIQELKDTLQQNAKANGVSNVVEVDINNQPLIQENAVDDTLHFALPSVKENCNDRIQELHTLDNSLYATMDEDAFNSLIQYKLRKLWNHVLNNDVKIEDIDTESGSTYFNIIKESFLSEYRIVDEYAPPIGYTFKYPPNLMQKLTVQRLLDKKSYGNWSGTGAGKTLSFIIASRQINAKLTVVIAVNSTVTQLGKVIKDVYKDSKVFSEYISNQVFDRTHNNYLVLNYEKFQQKYSEELYQNLTNNNQIDFVVIDEVHNTKIRSDDEESIRRGVLERLLGRIREKNDNLYVLAMSATPVINTLNEAKSLLTLMTGLEYDDLKTQKTVGNVIKMFQQLLLNGLRYIPKYDMNITELTGSNMSNLNIDGNHLLDALSDLPKERYVDAEKLLVDDKLKASTHYIRKGVIIYSYYTTGFIDKIKEYVQNLGFNVASYTGEESHFYKEETLQKYIKGEIDVLVASKPIGTGVDGLQNICDRMIIISLPWTHAEYDQLRGRIYRQGSSFKSVEIIIPQVRIDREDGYWSWDIDRLNVIKRKKTLADAAVDGIFPSRMLPSPETLFKHGQESLQRWKDRQDRGEIVASNRQPIKLDLYPGLLDIEKRKQQILSELSEFNQRGKITKSSTMHREFNTDPHSWYRYHKLRKESVERWEEIPYEYIATKIKNPKDVVVDFGCGLNEFRKSVPNEVIAFDHIACDDSVIACDMRNVSEYVKDNTVRVAVFSLALWGTNYIDYIKEAYRILEYGGQIHIAEPSKNYEDSELVNLLTDTGFRVLGEIERRGKFIYISGVK